jgi:hypothetical protein
VVRLQGSTQIAAPFWIIDAAKGILSGMSGTKADRSSPIRGADHAATTKGHDHAQTKRIAIGGEAYAVSL